MAGEDVAEELEMHQQAAQKVGDHEGDTRHPKVVQQGDRTKKLGASIKHNLYFWS